jgi:hypothetical protein
MPLAQSRCILQLTERRERFHAQLNTENTAELLLALGEKGLVVINSRLIAG